MSRQRNAWLALFVLIGVLRPLIGAEPLHPAFIEERERDPFLQPANAQISGPLSGERLEDDWLRVPQTQEPALNAEPHQIFNEEDDENCVDTSGNTVIRQRAIIDTGLTATWLAPVQGFGVTDVDARASTVIPVFVKGSPLRWAFTFGSTMFDAPRGLDIPDQVYGLQSELRWLFPLREGLALDTAAGIGVFSDFTGSPSRGFRVTGRAILLKDLSPRVKGSIGFLYLGRENLKAIPVAGLILLPSDDVRIELLIPRLRAARRIKWDGTREHWIYAGTELFGGNSWAVEHSNGAEDVLVYRDYRLLVGYETKAPGAVACRFEAGYVFARKVEFEKSPAALTPDGTIMLRAGVTY